MQDAASRAAGKLDAALAAFGLAERVRGATAVDVGASSGGFTGTLLRHGARHVTAVDVGHGQLHERLRADPRVESLEGVDWKTLSLSVAPGPFDFFSVDVSFVAARSMLRGLAFRLRPGAEGVVLVKPQFELPKGRVQGGVSTPEQRRAAVSRVAERAEKLGFELVGSCDSPVPGASGTVEVLAHLRFRGRPARLPAPGERRRPDDAASREAAPEAPAAADVHRFFLVASPGAEPVVLREAASLEGVARASAAPGGVLIEGALELALRANLGLRAASRVWLRLGEVEAREFAQLRRRSGTLPWEAFVPAGAALHVTVSATRCRLYHTDAVAETIELAVHDRLRRRGAVPGRTGTIVPDGEAALPVRLLARGEGDRWTLSVDASGELLHRRGWRRQGGAAPLRETLAATILGLAGWDPATPLVDPLCGSGTVPIEAAGIALGRAPGLGRSFACERWPSLDADRCRKIRAEAEARAAASAASLATASRPAPILGFDRSAEAIVRARRHAEDAGVAARVTFAEGELADLRAPRGHGRGLVVANPPYGRRLESPRSASDTYARLGWVLKERFARWRAAIVVPTPELARALKMEPAAEHRLAHGGLRVRLLCYQL